MVVVVTGATSGMGRALALGFVERGTDVVVVGRDTQRTQRLLADLTRAADASKQVRPARVSSYMADLTQQEQVRDLAAGLAADSVRADVLINNAGAAFDRFALTPDGAERTHALNHLAPFLLTHDLLANGVLGPGSRVVNMSSFMEKHGRLDTTDPDVAGVSWTGRRYSQNRVYSTSKLLAVLATTEIAHRLPAGVNAFSADPGMVRTGFRATAGGGMRLIDPLNRLFARTVEEGIATPLWLATAIPAPGPNGGFFARSQPRTPSARARDRESAQQVYQRTAEWLGIGSLPHPSRL